MDLNSQQSKVLAPDNPMGGLVFWRNALIHHAQLSPGKVDALIEQWRQEGYPDGFLGWYALRKRIVAASMVQLMLENLFAERQEAAQRKSSGLTGAAGAVRSGVQITRAGIKRQETEARIKARAESRDVMERKMRESGVAPGIVDPSEKPAPSSVTQTHLPKAVGRKPFQSKEETQGTVAIPLPSPRFSKTDRRDHDPVPRPTFQADLPSAAADSEPAIPVLRRTPSGPVPTQIQPPVPPPPVPLALAPPSTAAPIGQDRPKTGALSAARKPPSDPALDVVKMAGGIAAPRVGSQFGSILLTRVLGQGGAGIVYHGWNMVKEMPCAIKLLLKNSTEGAKDEINMTAFRREAEITAHLSHPNIVCVQNFGEEGGFPFMELEYVDGLSAAELLRYAGRVTPSRAIKIVMAACEGLDHALANGIVHRDVKPGNFLLDRAGQVKISDFGLAYTYVPQTGDDAAHKNIMGTPTYMAPEQSVPGSLVDYRADIYALGITLYHLIAGVPPFPGRDPAEIIFAHRNQPPPPLSQYVANLPAGLWAIISRMIEKTPNDRPDSYSEILQSLGTF